MNCVSIQEKDFDKCLTILKMTEMAEIRMDLCLFNKSQLSTILALNNNIIVTCRIENTSRDEAIDTLTYAIENGAKYIDIEIEAPIETINLLKAKSLGSNCKLIISYHNFEGTPSSEELQNIYNDCINMGADVVKIVTTALNTEDGVRTLELYKTNKNINLVAFAMGAAGKFTRSLCLLLGSPYAYVAADNASCTASGQYTIEEIIKLQDVANYPYKFDRKYKLPKEVKIPASKSFAQRAILFAALAQEESVFTNFSPCNDILGAIALIKVLGAEVTINQNTLKIKGIDITNANAINIRTGESGLLTRMLLPFALYLSDKTQKAITIEGEGSILNRSLSESITALKCAGAQVQAQNDRLPITISGGYNTDIIKFSGKASSQIVSGFLMTLPLLGRNLKMEIIEPTSIPYIDLTLKILELFGVEIEIIESSRDYLLFDIVPSSFKARNLHLDSDWSSAAFFAVAGAIAGEIVLQDMPRYSSQADERILEILQKCGVKIRFDVNNDIHITRRNELMSFSTDATHCPDLFPILAVLASHCQGTSKIKGVSRLTQKESNRAESIYSEFTKMGADISIDGDYMYIQGPTPLHGANLLSHNDHRIAMSLIIASLFIEEPISIDNINCINKSFPEFINLLEK